MRRAVSAQGCGSVACRAESVVGVYIAHFFEKNFEISQSIHLQRVT